MEWVSGNIFIRPCVMAKGQVIHGHKHNFHHTSIVFTGAVNVKITRQNLDMPEEQKAQAKDFFKKIGVEWMPPPDQDIREQEFRAPAHFLVSAGIEHEITALEDNTVFWCVYSHRDPQSHEVVQENLGWYAATT